MRLSPRDRSPAPLGSRLLGGRDESSRLRRARVQILLTVFLLGANAVGAALIPALLLLVPGPNLLQPPYLVPLAIAGPTYTVVAFVIGAGWGTIRTLNSLRWSFTGREPTPKEQRAALVMPWRLTRLNLTMWTGGLIVLGTVTALVDVDGLVKVTSVVALSGLVVAAFGFLFSEFALRPAAARALASGRPARVRLTGVAGRTIMAWALGSGVPVVGLIMIAITSMIREDVTVMDMAVAILGLGGIILIIGPALMLMTSAAITAPIRSVRAGMDRVQAGRLDVELSVFDGSELGRLQSGFNRMAEGLLERERIRDLFGRQVGAEVAEAALRDNPELGGQERRIAAYFIDLIGSTELAASRPPTEVVDLLNRFFAIVVDEVLHHGGIVNKFEGDAVLAVFGAPAPNPDPAGSALAAAVRIRERLAAEMPECEAAGGISFGTAVAGNVGADRRYEYTVIGDPVNEAARLAELAKTDPARLLASEATVRAADPKIAREWEVGEQVVLRGRPTPTPLARPCAEKASDEADREASSGAR